jgi:hypothetical protein
MFTRFIKEVEIYSKILGRKHREHHSIFFFKNEETGSQCHLAD